MTIGEYIEVCLAYLVYRLRGHDARLFIKGPSFKDHPTPTIDINSPSCGPSGSVFTTEYIQLGADLFPSLEWQRPKADVKEYALIVEDADLPIPGFVAQKLYHGLYDRIPGTRTSISAQDFGPGNAELSTDDFRCIKNLRGKAYIGPKPVLGHGSHRYFYQLVALDEPLELKSEQPTKAKVAEACVGKVVGWGVWEGSLERKQGE